MNQLTYDVLVKKYSTLHGSHRGLFAFNSLEDWLSEFDGKDVKAGPFDWRVTRIDDTGDFEAGNVRLVKIETDDDLASYSYPTV